ncbi:MAG: DUF1302 family protein [Panacagrimonas sp.]
MQKKNSWGSVLGTAALALFAVSTELKADTIMGEWRVRGFLDNDTRYRTEGGKDLTKERNTVRFDADRKFEDLGPLSNLAFNVKLRATYDGVYDLNSDEYGKDAGRAICLEDTSGLIARGCVPHGRGAFDNGPLLGGGPGSDTNLAYGAYATFLPGRFGFNSNDPDSPNYNPNEGLIVLGEDLHPVDGGVAFGVPVRPCDIDNRGCIPGYIDGSLDDLRFQEFADEDRLDWLREIYFDASLNVLAPWAEDEQEIFFRIGKQQVIWGRTDLFRVLDIVNPIDYGRNNIYDENQDIRIPKWIATAEYRMGPALGLADFNMQLVWDFDQFRPVGIGQCGTANVVLDAACLFRGLKNLWDNGGTVSNFALNPPIVGQGPPSITTDFGPNQIGIRRANLPSHNLSNTSYGAKFEGVAGPITFSLNAYFTRSGLPALTGGTKGPPSENPFLAIAPDGTAPYLIAFDIDFPRVKVFGGSLDFTIDSLKTIHRIEFAYSQGEAFADTNSPTLGSESDVVRYVIGLDRLGFIKLLNPNRTFLFSGQLFGQHVLDYVEKDGEFGTYGFADYEHNWIATLYIQTWYVQDRIQPKWVTAYDFGARAYVTQPYVDYLLTQNFKVTVGANIKFGDGAQKFNDCRDCNPYPPFSNYGLLDGPGPVGITGFEPLGKFKQGPIGSSDKEDELFINLSYGFF